MKENPLSVFVHGHREGLFHMLRILWLIVQHRWEPTKTFTGTLWAIYPQSACQKGSKFRVVAAAAPTPPAPPCTEAVSDSITAFNPDAGPPMAPQQETDTFSLLPTCSEALIGPPCQTETKSPTWCWVNSSFLASELMVKVYSSIQVFLLCQIFYFKKKKILKIQKVTSYMTQRRDKVLKSIFPKTLMEPSIHELSRGILVLFAFILTLCPHLSWSSPDLTVNTVCWNCSLLEPKYPPDSGYTAPLFCPSCECRIHSMAKVVWKWQCNTRGYFLPAEK